MANLNTTIKTSKRSFNLQSINVSVKAYAMKVQIILSPAKEKVEEKKRITHAKV